MKPIIIFSDDVKDTYKLTRKQIEDICEDAFNQGVEYGKQQAAPITLPSSTPYIDTTTPYIDTTATPYPRWKDQWTCSTDTSRNSENITAHNTTGYCTCKNSFEIPLNKKGDKVTIPKCTSDDLELYK